jgi:hypothetical protein
MRLDFEDWRQLLQALSPAMLNRNVLTHVGLTLEPDRVTILDAQGLQVSMEDAHVRVQEDQAAQHSLYQAAMGLWR